MTRTALSLALGFGLVGVLAAESAHPAPPYATSTGNVDGSRTMCGPYGCTTVPASQLEGSAAWYGSTASRGRVDSYGNRDYGYSNYGYGGTSRSSATSFDPYSWDSRGRTLPSRTGYGASRSYDSRYGSGYNSGYDSLGYGSGCGGSVRGGYGARSTGYGYRADDAYRYGTRTPTYRSYDRWSTPY